MQSKLNSSRSAAVDRYPTPKDTDVQQIGKGLRSPQKDQAQLTAREYVRGMENPSRHRDPANGYRYRQLNSRWANICCNWRNLHEERLRGLTV